VCCLVLSATAGSPEEQVPLASKNDSMHIMQDGYYWDTFVKSKTLTQLEKGLSDT